MAVNRQSEINHTIKLISQAKQIENRFKKETNDPNCLYRFYDRNKALRVAVDSIDGKATGTCVKESQEHVVELLNSGFNVEDIKLMKSQIYNEVWDKNIFHQFLVIKINGKWYNETHANGLHKRVPMEYWLKHNQLVDGTIKELTLKVKEIKFHKKKKCNKKSVSMKQVKRRMNRKKKSHWRQRVKQIGKANIIVNKI
jgi:hypothetical protein